METEEVRILVPGTGTGIGPVNSTAVRGALPVLFFDIDNCLYPRSSNVQDTLSDLIDDYLSRELRLPRDQAIALHSQYFKTYGQTVEGLVRHHAIDALHYNSQVDDALPLETLLKPNPILRQFLQSIDTSKVRLWLLTNAYVTHARRVVKLLGIEDLFEGITYCDYEIVPFICKPQVGMFEKAMREAGVGDVGGCFFVDDSFGNCVGAKSFGWTACHLVETGLPIPESQASQHRIQHLEELTCIWPDFFRAKSVEILA
ncbi:Haloacid dehalogenase-like hydrolase-domain-containing protein [Penicillium waksmanii]|uniref:Haloacid dehalogenase-like hydrolase-domain-containing protein n=1 Tax=Penicillium waksmanii TaxID=69791 RepID=UPI002549A000|nr:Haloacid dehalogenase-like hydrolase-domain-containing protein [Penicillium waksmanii]KAJ5987868.1 Haloacid dehalogenase-like hydrolase-domain-containing protein [Penicillium waksmanii]